MYKHRTHYKHRKHKNMSNNNFTQPIRNVRTLLVVAALLTTHTVLLVTTDYPEYTTKVFLKKPRNQTNNADKRHDFLIPLPQPTIGMGNRRSYSNHFCVGPFIETPNDKAHKNYGTSKFKSVMRSCHFTDVCFDKKGTLLYYMEKDESVDIPSLKNELQTCLHGQDYWVGPDHQHPRKRHKPLNKHRWLLPKIKQSPRPQTCTWAPTKLAIPYLPSHISNFGHCLLDNVMSFYRLMKLFDFYTDGIDFVPLRMNGSDYEPGNEPNSIMLSKILDPFLGYSMTNSAETGYFPSYFANHTTTTNGADDIDDDDACLCFENVISGKYIHTDHGLDETQHGWMLEHKKSTNPFFVGRGDLLRDFRNSYMKRMGLDPGQLGILSRNKDNTENSDVVIIPRLPGKGTKSGTWDHTALVQHLSANLGRGSDVGSASKITVIDVNSMTIEDQIRITSSAKVLISMRGGGSLLSVFLPRGATLVLLDRNEKSFDDMLYDNIAYFHVVKEPAKSLISENESGDENLHSFDLDSIWQQVSKGIKKYDRAIGDQ